MVSAAILAGGHATRFGGRDKSALIVGGRSILDRQMEALAPLTDDLLIAGSLSPGRLDRHVQARTVQDRLPGSGPLGGLDAALAAARHDTLVVVACDMPFITTALLRHLVSLAAEADAVVPCTEDGYHPLCAVYTRACHPVIMQRLAERRLAVNGLFDEVKLRLVTAEELAHFGHPARLLANVNTPDAFDAIEMLQIHEP